MITNFKLTFIAIVLAAFVVFLVTGCNTAHGFGTDMKEAGHDIEKGTK